MGFAGVRDVFEFINDCFILLSEFAEEGLIAGEAVRFEAGVAENTESFSNRSISSGRWSSFSIPSSCMRLSSISSVFSCLFPLVLLLLLFVVLSSLVKGVWGLLFMLETLLLSPTESPIPLSGLLCVSVLLLLLHVLSFLWLLFPI